MSLLTYRGAPHQADSPTLRVKNVSLNYASLGNLLPNRGNSPNALENISFQVEEGEQIAVIGPNGAGKSTLLKVVAGILKPDSGSVEMYGSAPDKHICIGYVPQRNEIDWSFPVTVADVALMGRAKQIGLFRRPQKRDHQKALASLERVGAAHLARKQIGELSGGQQQRVFIARALAQEAHLLLMDEPFAGLDIPSQEKTIEILEMLRVDGVTALIATHDLGVAGEKFDRIILLNKRICALGTAAETLTSNNLLLAYGGRAFSPENSAVERLKIG